MKDIEEEDDDYQVDDYQNIDMRRPVPSEYVAALQFQKIYGNIDNWDYIIEDIYDALYDAFLLDLFPDNPSDIPTSDDCKMFILEFMWKSPKVNERIGIFLCKKFNKLLSNGSDGVIRITMTSKQKEVYFEQYITKHQNLDIQQFKDALTNIRAGKPCQWKEISSKDFYIPENVVFYLNRVSEDAFKSIGQKVSVGEEQHNAIPLKYEIGLPKKSPCYKPHPIYPSILEPNRKYIDSGFEDAKSSYTNSEILIDIKLLQSHKELFQYRIYLAIAMLYFYECAHFLMDNGFVLEDGILHLDKHSVKYLAYLTLESDNIAEVTMEESIATAFMLNCIKTVAPDDYPVAEKIVQETWSPACRFGLKQLEVGAKWQDWREAKTHKDSLQLNEWFEKYFSNENINDSIAYEPKDYKRALGLS